MFREQFAIKLATEMERHPSDRQTGEGWGRIAMELAADAQREAAPEDHPLRERLLVAMMTPDYRKPTQLELRNRKRWDAIASNIGHQLGDCFDTPEGLCKVCAL